MHVDGFRFDLAAALGRGTTDLDPFGAFLETVGQDPVLAGVKLIAEPWDTGWGGYEVGDFPAGWSEWNGRYRDTVRDFWRAKDGTCPTSPPAWPARPTSTGTAAGDRPRRSTSSPSTTGSRSPTS
jgi:pullulanase/glycogen debranching enzyme